MKTRTYVCGLDVHRDSIYAAVYYGKERKQELELLQTIPGIKEQSAMQIISETGGNMDAFESSSKMVGWAGLRPGNDESAGKIKSIKITKGNRYLKRILIQIAWGAARTRACAFNIKYQHLAKRISRKKALVAISRK